MNEIKLDKKIFMTTPFKIEKNVYSYFYLYNNVGLYVKPD